MLHLFVGDGPGKTSTAVGYALRSAGHGMRVTFAQFLKDGNSGEINLLRSFGEINVIIPSVDYGFVSNMSESEIERTTEECNRILDKVLMMNSEVVILDEFLHAFDFGMISYDSMLSVMEQKDTKEIFMTGNHASEWLIQQADYVVEYMKKKHPYDKGIEARIGIEY